MSACVKGYMLCVFLCVQRGTGFLSPRAPTQHLPMSWGLTCEPATLGPVQATLPGEG